ncbi:MAG: hypothetical protein WC087_02320 [Candidatus Paceibacterota bacterium]
MRDVFHSILITLLVFISIIPVISVGQVRESANYKIERDSLNVGGGFSSSANYQTESSVGEVSTGFSDSDNYTVSAGFQQSLEASYISISSPADLNMDSVNGLTGGVSTSSIAWTVTTNNNAGYSLAIKASTDPALKSVLDEFQDYGIAVTDPDFDFSIDSTTAEFGFSPSGTHILDKFKDNGSVCNSGSGDTLYKCWEGLATSSQTVAQSASSNDPSGTVTTIHFQAESGADKILTAGSYSATITMTALAL